MLERRALSHFKQSAESHRESSSISRDPGLCRNPASREEQTQVGKDPFLPGQLQKDKVLGVMGASYLLEEAGL